MVNQSFLDAVSAFQQNEYAAAAQHTAQAAAADSNDKLYEHAARYLATVAERGTHDMYASPEGFTAFVRGGGNVPLYAKLSDQLRAIYAAQSDMRLLDIGVGDGLALLPALTDTLSHIDLVEPASAMLANVANALSENKISHSQFNTTIGEFMPNADSKYDAAQATFAMHNLPPTERGEVLGWVRERSNMMLIAEFDVQMDVVLGSAEHISYLATRYREGIAEYLPDEDLVAQGFLMPILFRNFETLGEAAIYEQPIATWQQELEAAGFTSIERHFIHAYWWADAYLLVAQ